MQVLNGLRNTSMAQMRFYAEQVSTLIKQVGGKAVPEGVNGVMFSCKHNPYQRFARNVLNGSHAILFAFSRPVKQIPFRSVLHPIGPLLKQHGFAQNGKPILVPLTTYHFNSCGIAVDVCYLK